MPIHSPSSHYRALRDLVQVLIRHRQLIWEFAKRDVGERFAGQMFGVLWVVGHPLALMAIYLFIFAFVFNVRVKPAVDFPVDYTVYLLSGLVPWMTFQEVMSKAAVSVTGNANLVKQVVFPLEVIPVKVVLAALMTQVVSISVLVVYVLFRFQVVPWTFCLIPVFLLFQTMAMIGVSYLLASIGVYFRDLKDFIQVFCVAGMYILPIFYLPEMVPQMFRPILYLNPFSYMIWSAQDIFFYGRIEHPVEFLLFIMMSIVLFYGGYHVFSRLKNMFGNVL